jgi:hypothetical protein
VQTAFEVLHADAQASARDLAARVADGSLSAAEFGDAMAAILTDAHTRAVVIGRQHAGDTAPEEADDRAFAELVMDGEAEFLSKFVTDLSAGRYRDEDGAWRTQGMQHRAGMYADKLLGTANEAWSLTLPETTLYYWHLGQADHCDDCKELQLHSPYTGETIPTWPGKADTLCRTNCRCYASTSSGRRSLRIPEGDTE